VTTVSTSDDKLIVEIKGWDQVWALKRRLVISLDHVTGIRTGAQEIIRGIRIPGTYVPGIVAAGTFYDAGEKVFWAVHDSERTIAIDLQGEDYSMLVLEVADPDATIRDIERALAHTNV
jgi:hypothetical protein